MAAGATPRRRFPRRRQVKKLLSAVMTEESIGEDYRKGAVDALRWLLFDTELSTQFSWSTMRKLERQGAKVIPIRPEPCGPEELSSEEPAEEGCVGSSGASGKEP